MSIDRPNIDRAMVSLFFEIKRNMPLDQREGMKISSPNIAQQLIGIYEESSNNALKQLIHDFMVRAGDSWAKKLRPIKKRKQLFPREAIVTRINLA